MDMDMVAGMVMLPPVTWWRVLSVWRPGPVVFGLALVAVVGYVCAVQEVNARYPDRRWPRRCTAAFAAGVAVAVFAISGSPGVYGQVLFCAHMVRHLLLIMVAPWLLAAGCPVGLAVRVARGGVRRRLRVVLGSAPVAVLTHPWVAVAGYVAVVAGVHLSGFMQAMMVHPALGDVENAAYLGVGYLFFSQALGGEASRWRPGLRVRLAMEAAALAADVAVGLVLVRMRTVPWPAYAGPHRGWGPAPLADLHAGGAVMGLVGGGLMLAMIAVTRPREPVATALTRAKLVTYRNHMCDLSSNEQGALAGLLGELHTAQARLSATFPDIFARSWADHEAILGGLDDLGRASDNLRQWVTAKHHSTMATPAT